MSLPQTNVLKSGWLTKRGGIRKNWKKRWFVLYDNNEAIYYETEEAGKELGKIELHKAVAVGNSVEKDVPDFALDIVTPERTWVLVAEKEDVREQWIDSLNESVGTHSSAFESTKEGYLTKKGNVVKSWRKRYFALGAGCLFYFQNTEECEKFKRIAGHSQEMFQNAFQHVRGSVPLEKAEISRMTGQYEEKINVFSIETSRRTYYMYAENIAETDKWIDEIEKEIQAWITHRSEGMLSNEYSSDEEQSSSDEDEETKAVDYGPRLSKSEEEVLQRWIKDSKKGVRMTVHAEESSSTQTVEIDTETGLLQWDDGEILIGSIVGILKGKEHEFFKSRSEVDPTCCFSIISKLDEFHLETDGDQHERDKWVSCLKVLSEREKCKNT